jgi:nitroimidazol reductase NimA-like FMN-containing flavoprotein (pyridoxamine 5'-phosphate oxidase superfamily)
VPVWVGLEGDRVAFFTQPGSRKAQNLARDPRVAISLTDTSTQPMRSGVVFLVEPECSAFVALPFAHAPPG